jgi:phosphate:Na+ symporter
MTAILQSSSAFSVIVAGLVDSGILSFHNSLGLVFGMNIGTTMTSQLIALDFMKLSPLVIVIGLLFMWWGNDLKRVGKIIVDFGMIFLSIYLISYFVSGVDGEIIRTGLSYVNNIYMAIALGAVSALVLQSSSVTIGIALVLVMAGPMNLETAIGILLGANIGTTSTVLLASLALGRGAKAVAVAHFMFNVIGVILVLPLLGYFYSLIESIGGGLAQQVANFNLAFNIFCVIVFLVAFKPFAILVEKITSYAHRGRENF